MRAGVEPTNPSAQILQIAASFVAPIVDAMQAEGIASTAKHFIGDGGTLRGDDRGDTSLPLEELVAIHGQGYVEAIDKDVMSVMSSFNSWYGDKIHGSKAILTDLLRGDMGFEGMVVSDWNGVGEVLGCTNDDCAQAVNAGIDMVMVPADWKTLYNNMLEQVAAGEISEARIDEAVSRILVMKIRAGLFTRGLPSKFAADYRDQIGHTDHRAIAREAVRKSQVLLKNNQQLLPLRADQPLPRNRSWRRQYRSTKRWLDHQLAGNRVIRTPIFRCDIYFGWSQTTIRGGRRERNH